MFHCKALDLIGSSYPPNLCQFYLSLHLRNIPKLYYFFNAISISWNKYQHLSLVIIIFLQPILMHQHCVKIIQIRSFFWFAFSCVRTEYGDLLCKSLYSVRIQENTQQEKLRIWTLFTQCKTKLKRKKHRSMPAKYILNVNKI